MNTTAKNLILSNGAVSKLILSTAGPQIQAECQQLAPDGVDFGDVIETSGYNLPCTKVYHGACVQWDNGAGQCETVSAFYCDYDNDRSSEVLNFFTYFFSVVIVIVVFGLPFLSLATCTKCGLLHCVHGDIIGCLHDPANVQQTSSKCVHNTRANAGRLLEVCWTFAGSCKHPIKVITLK